LRSRLLPRLLKLASWNAGWKTIRKPSDALCQTHRAPFPGPLVFLGPGREGSLALSYPYAMFDYDAAAITFAPATLASKPPVGHNAKRGAACHTLAASKDYFHGLPGEVNLARGSAPDEEFRSN